MSRAVKNTNNGFTLVEVMVALLIVAMAVSSLLFQMVSTIDNTAYLRDQTIAHWVALNQLELVYLENQYTNKVISEPRAGSEIMANRDWHWTINPINTANKNFLQLDVSVRAKEDDESPIVTVTGMVDQFHGR
ncbi:general secretion pathway protein I [marine gamma proteobacterium HTCC2143]|jgi:general secretion pathway protein I|uniref:Type II secretion system protein I n=1 Tax=marine gamma proteobacterium HTCC2143 TaxID=247633 RepID=A0YG38_9GAMM|nr:general secretion pathway protein I [marine gamma proteobacterium HTCC2143]